MLGPTRRPEARVKKENRNRRLGRSEGRTEDAADATDTKRVTKL
jgi:hypothetical protein